MKKLLVFFLLMCTLISFNGCFFTPQDTPEPESEPTEEKECEHIWKSADCTKSETCSLCGIIKGSPLGHTTSSGVCTRCNENLSAWSTGEFVDEFKQPTGEKYIITHSYGTFSNSATTNSNLYAAVQVTQEDIAIMLWEYNNNLVKGTYDSNEYRITVLDSKGEKHYFNGNINKGGTRVYIRSNQFLDMINLLKTEEELSFYLEFSKYTTSSYLFKIETRGFNEMLSLISN